MNTLDIYTRPETKRLIKPHHTIDPMASDLLEKNTLGKEESLVFLLYNTHEKG